MSAYLLIFMVIVNAALVVFNIRFLFRLLSSHRHVMTALVIYNKDNKRSTWPVAHISLFGVIQPLITYGIALTMLYNQSPITYYGLWFIVPMIVPIANEIQKYRWKHCGGLIEAPVNIQRT